MEYFGYLVDLGEQPIPLRPGDRLTFGRGKNNVYTISDSLLSRNHAVLEVSPVGEVTLEDLGSTNRTFVNEKPLDANTPTPLKDGDVIQLGTRSITFRRQIDGGEAYESSGENLATLQLDPSVGNAIRDLKPESQEATRPPVDPTIETGFNPAPKYPDQVKMATDAGPKTVTIEEWLAIPGQDRIDILLNSKVEFMCRGKVLPTDAAMAMLRKGPPS